MKTVHFLYQGGWRFNCKKEKGIWVNCSNYPSKLFRKIVRLITCEGCLRGLLGDFQSKLIDEESKRDIVMYDYPNDPDYLAKRARKCDKLIRAYSENIQAIQERLSEIESTE